MIKRFKWFSTEWPVSPRSIGKQLAKHEYNQKTNEGFILDRARNTYIEGRYGKVMRHSVEVIGPLGEKFSETKTEIRETSFLIDDSPLGLCIINPSNFSGTVCTKISEALMFNCTITACQINLEKFTHHFSREYSNDIFIDKMKASKIEIDPSVFCQSVFTSDKDISDSVKKFLKGRKHSIEMVQIRIPSLENSWISITSSAGVKINSKFPEKIPLEKIKECLILSL